MKIENMKKSGFTLLELIVTIGVMALIGLVISTNMLGMFNKEEDKEYQAFVRRIEEAACVYVDIASVEEDGFNRSNCRNNNGCVIKLQELINKGLIDEDLKDPNTGSGIDVNKSVKIQWINNEKQCKYE